MGSQPDYVLGTDAAEIARLDVQAAAIAPATAVLLRAAGIGPGMRVLDLGTGLGHVAFAVAELVGPDGAVVGVDQAAPLLAVADERRRAAELAHVRFVESDVRTFEPTEPFDAAVARLLMFHLPDAVAVARRQLSRLRPGGRIVLIDFDLGGARTEPAVPLLATLLGWVERAFRSAGADPRIGARLGPLLGDAGAVDVTTFGLQRYFAPDDPHGPALLSGVVRALAGQITAAGIASPDELGLDTLHDRIADAISGAGAVLIPPTVAGAWGRRP